MAKNLLIVESPAKSKTIKKYLGDSYEVIPCVGHVRDLPKSSMGIDIDNDFEPKYITVRGKGDVVAKLKKEVKKADKIYLATDPDREGEAMSWHLMHILKLNEQTDKKVYRITFDEITKAAVKESIKNARAIDMDLVDAQQARRVLDRMVGYSISPLLWAKVKRGLSAGRVQSVALKLVADREKEVEEFVPTEYWTLEGEFIVEGEKKTLQARYTGLEGAKAPKDKKGFTKEEVDSVVSQLKGASFVVSDVKRGERISKAPLPFTTSTMQQEASKTLNFSTQKTMSVAQQLYEEGYITYLRTDSTRISDDAKAMAKEYIDANYGTQYSSEEENTKKTGKKIQDAHEAIRPSDLKKTPVTEKAKLSKDGLRLYTLIWKRFVASRMVPAKYETNTVVITGEGHQFCASGSKVVFDGYRSVYMSEDDKIEAELKFKNLEKGCKLSAKALEPSQHFTQGPARYTEASLVKTMEELGIGRPSTYAATITTILARRYATKEKKNLYLTELGDVVNKIMTDSFGVFVDVTFTANMEALLDGVEEGSVQWKSIIRNFYPDLKEAVDIANQDLEHVKLADELTGESCDLCGRPMVYKYGAHGKFLACSGFPECRNTKSYFEKVGVPCPQCGKDVVIRKTQKGRRYYGCIDNPECDFMTWQKPTTTMCEKCGKVMVERGAKLVCSDEKCGFSISKSKQ